MKKKIIATLSLAALLLGLVASIVPTVSASTEIDDRFQVGYSKKDINPWIKTAYTGNLGVENTGFNDPQHIVNIEVTNPNNTAEKIMQPIIAVPMAGYSNPLNRLSGQMVDDNGDGMVGLGDGLFTTCTAVTDQRGTTVLYITLDALHTYEEFYEEVIPAVSAAVGVPESNIMFSTSHNHEGPEYDYLKWYGKGSVNGVGNYNSWGAYFDYAKAQIVAAAVAACADRTEAQMYKGEIDAKAATAALGYNSGVGLQMNSVRHYYIRNGYGGTRTFVGSNEFNSFSNKITTVSGEHRYNDGNTPYGNVAEANDTMYLLEFVPTDGADPIVLVNWRAHPSFIGGTSANVLSSDYINFLRNYLEEQDYRVAFFQGAAGNINPRDLYNQDCWSRHLPDGLKYNSTSGLKRCEIYGELLGEVAEYGLENAMGQELPGGTIRMMHDVYQAQKNSGTATVDQPLDVIALGQKVMMVVGAGEYFDRYDANYATNYRNVRIDPTNPTDRSVNISNYTANDWDKLVDEDTYGTPFFFGYSTAHNNYVPNTMAYDYNKNLTNKTTPTLDDGTTVAFQTHSYEAASSSSNDMKRGEGEKIITRMAQMVKAVSNARYAYCAYCEETVLWTALDSSNGMDVYLKGGHHYLAEDIIGTNARTKLAQGTVCLDLNGKTFAPQNTTNGNLRGTPFILYGTATLNIMDNGTTGSVGKLIGVGDADNIGGVISLWGSGAQCNLYAGMLQYNGTSAATGNGGVVYVNSNAIFNMYGGTIQGKAVYGYGAAVFVRDNAQFNMYGGNLIKGSAGNGGDCVYLQTVNARFLLAGNATVDEIMFAASQSGTTSLTNLTVEGNYTGTAQLAFKASITPSNGMTLGSAVNAVIPNGAIHYTAGGQEYHVVVDGNALKLVTLPNAQ